MTSDDVRGRRAPAFGILVAAGSVGPAAPRHSDHASLNSSSLSNNRISAHRDGVTGHITATSRPRDGRGHRKPQQWTPRGTEHKIHQDPPRSAGDYPGISSASGTAPTAKETSNREPRVCRTSTSAGRKATEALATPSVSSISPTVANHRSWFSTVTHSSITVSYTHLRAHETVLDIVCRLL